MLPRGLPPLRPVGAPETPASHLAGRGSVLGEGLGVGATHPTLHLDGTGPQSARAAVMPPGWALRLWGDLLPPQPAVEEFPTPALPAMPTVPEVASTHAGFDVTDAATGGVEASRALAVYAHTYWSCVERGWGLPGAPRRRFVGNLTAAKRTALERVAQTLTAMGVRPAEWITLRLVAWQRCRVVLGKRPLKPGPPGHGDTRTPAGVAPYPAFAWVMAAAAVERYIADGASRPTAPTPAVGLRTPALLPTPVRGLLAAWQGARVALLTLPAGATREDAERAVRTHLGAWQTRVAEARAALELEARTVARLALRGEWVWPLPAITTGSLGGAGVSVAELAVELDTPTIPSVVRGFLQANGPTRLAASRPATTHPASPQTTRPLPALPPLRPLPALSPRR